MGNARLYRMKGRKLGEIVLYASMIALEPERRNELVGLIGRINDDINDIECLSSGAEMTYHDRIKSERYLARLSDAEIEDENYLAELRSEKESVPECAFIEDAVLSEPAESIVEIEVQEVPEEDVPVEEVFDKEMSEEDVPDEEIPEEEVFDEEISEEDVPVEEISEEEVSDEDVLDEESEETSVEDTTGEAPDEETSVDETSEEEASAGLYMQPLFTGDDMKMLNDIRMMKDSKIDLFIERELTGNFKEEACEDVIRFTKIDIRLIDLLLKLDYSDRDSLRSDLKVLVDIVNCMDAPKYGKLYINSLTKDEAKLEVRYNEFIDRVDELVKSRFPEIVPGSE